MKVKASGKKAKWEAEKQKLQPQIQEQEASVADLKGTTCFFHLRTTNLPAPTPSALGPPASPPGLQCAGVCFAVHCCVGLTPAALSTCPTYTAEKKEAAEAEQKRIDEEKRKARSPMTLSL